MLKCRVAFKNTKSHCSFTHIKHSFHQIYFNCIFSVYQFILISLSFFEAARAKTFLYGVSRSVNFVTIAMDRTHLRFFGRPKLCVFAGLFPVFVVIFCVGECTNRLVFRLLFWLV